jgi:hypothetical protein
MFRMVLDGDLIKAWGVFFRTTKMSESCLRCKLDYPVDLTVANPSIVLWLESVWYWNALLNVLMVC